MATENGSDEKRFESLLLKVIEKTEQTRGQITITASGVEFGNFEGVQRYANVLLTAGLVPPKMNLAQVVIAIMLGRRVGLAPEEAVASIYVVNNRANLFGDAPLGIARQHKDWLEDGFEEYWLVNGKPIEGTPPPEAFKSDSTTAVCKTKRRGAAKQKVTEFSIGHAKQAGLLGKNGQLYGGYPQRMLMFRARGYALRDNFGDALKGIGIAELQDPVEMQETAPPPPPGRHSLRNGHAPAPVDLSQTPELDNGIDEPPAVPDRQVGDEPEGVPEFPSDAKKDDF